MKLKLFIKKNKKKNKNAKSIKNYTKKKNQSMIQILFHYIMLITNK